MNKRLTEKSQRSEIFVNKRLTEKSQRGEIFVNKGGGAERKGSNARLGVAKNRTRARPQKAGGGG